MSTTNTTKIGKCSQCREDGVPVFAAQCILNLVPIGEPAPPPEEVDVCGPCLLRAEQENAEAGLPF